MRKILAGSVEIVCRLSTNPFEAILFYQKIIKMNGSVVTGVFTSSEPRIGHMPGSRWVLKVWYLKSVLSTVHLSVSLLHPALPHTTGGAQ